MAKPTEYPRWASINTTAANGELNIYEPSEAKKDIGWDVGDIPPRQWLNWMQNLNYQWIQYFDNQINQNLLKNKNTIYQSSSLPPAGDNKGQIIYAEDTELFYASNGSIWQQIITKGK